MRRTLIILAMVGCFVQPTIARTSSDIAELNQEQRNLVNVYVKTKECMIGAAHAGMKYIQGGPEEVQEFMVLFCGDTLRPFLMRRMTLAEATEVLHDMARNTYYEDVLGVPEPKIIRPRTRK